MNDALSSPRRELGSLQGGLWLLLQQSRCPSPLPARSLRVLAEQELHGKRFSRRLDSVTSQVFSKLSDSVILWNRGCAAAVPQTQGLHKELQVSFLPQTLPTSGWFPAPHDMGTPETPCTSHPTPAPVLRHFRGQEPSRGAAGTRTQHPRGRAEPGSKDGQKSQKQRVSLGGVRCGGCPCCPWSWGTHRGLSRAGMGKRSTESSLGSSSLCRREETWTAPLVHEWRSAETLGE